MASLIDWLAYDGARLATGSPVANGTATFYQVGTTSTLATVYSDADGLIVQANPVTLDAAGRATCYVRGACRIEIQDSAGLVVKSLDRANTVSAAQVELENPAFTGTDLTTGSSGVAGGRTDLNTVLTNMYASFGDVDWKVAGQYLQDLFSTNSIYFNVKSTTYGALGDDTADDTLAIQSAITAAAAAGGGIVFFPPGVYKITAALTIDAGSLRFEGVNQHTSIIKQYSATADWFTLTANADHTYINGLGFEASATTHTGSNIAFGNADDITINRCDFEGHAGADIYSTGVGKRLHVGQCEFDVVNIAQRCVRGNPSDSSISDCTVGYAVSPTNPLFDVTVVSGCNFATDVGALTLTVMPGTAGQCLSGNSFRFATGALNFFGGSAANCTESGSTISTTSGTVALFSASRQTQTTVRSSTIMQQWQAVTDNTTATGYTIDPRLGCLVRVTHTGNAVAAPHFLAPSSCWEGARLYVAYLNSNVNAKNVAFQTGVNDGFNNAATMNNVANGEEFVCQWIYQASTRRWRIADRWIESATSMVTDFTPA